MANNPSAKKRARKAEFRTEVNRARMSRIRTFIKKVEVAIKAGNRDAARTAFIEMQPELQRGVTKGVVRLNAASRKLSRLSARIKAL